jgi:hypothetical protein
LVGPGSLRPEVGCGLTGRRRDGVGADQGACEEQSAAVIPFPSGARVSLAGSVQILSHMWNGPPGKVFFQTYHHPGTVRSYVRPFSAV